MRVLVCLRGCWCLAAVVLGADLNYFGLGLLGVRKVRQRLDMEHFSDVFCHQGVHSSTQMKPMPISSRANLFIARGPQKLNLFTRRGPKD